VRAAGGRPGDAVSRVANAVWLSRKDADNEAYRVRVIGIAQTQTAQERAQAIADVVRKNQQHVKSIGFLG